ncbi:MAG: disulfide bond formation protein B [Burkholderiaceae bacterium]
MSEETGDDWVETLERPYAKYLLWTGLAAFGSVALAVGLQFYADMQPCAWCTLQRLLYLIIGAGAFAAWALADSPRAARVVSVVPLLAAFSGLAAAIYQHFVAAESLSCDLTFADKVIAGMGLDRQLPWLFEARAMCDEANMPLLGLPFSIWSAILFAMLATLLSITVFSRGSLR